jgi:transcriptional regulator with XRE-family HTH domain
MAEARGSLSQLAMARRANCGKTTVSRYENGQNLPTQQYVNALIAWVHETGRDDPDLVRRLRRIQVYGARPFDEAGDRIARLRRFLGLKSDDEPVQLAYPEFPFSRAARQALSTLDGAMLYDKPALYEHRRGAGILESVAANDIRSLCSVAQLLGEHGIATRIVTDRAAYLNGRVRPTVAFGMASNNLVFDYRDLCRLDQAKPLFQPIVDETGRPVVEYAAGRLDYDGNNQGLIARVTPSVRLSKRNWIFCAGVGPAGTEAAAFCLVEHWEWIDDLVGSSQFVLPVHCSSSNPALCSIRPEELFVAPD